MNVVYVVIMESGKIHSVYGSKSKAIAKKTEIEKLYENPIVEEFKVE